jgi:hypothetical protein
MVNFALPHDIRAGIGANVQSAAPYTITTGRDDNGDGVLNDRPEGVTRNSARGDARWDMSLRLTKSITFGGARAGTPQGRPVGDQVRPGPGAAGGRQGGGSAGALGTATPQRFTVEFYAQAFNLLNHTNFVNYSGNLLSPFYGLPTSAAQARRMEVGLQFRF